MLRQKTDNASRMRIGSTLDRYLIWRFLRIFLVSAVCATGLYLVVDFFDRINTFLKAGISLWILLEYFLYKLPLLASFVFGVAVLFSTLSLLAMLSKNQELTAMRASGISLGRISLPLLLASSLVGLFAFFWSEALVPIFARKAQYIYKTEIRKKSLQSIIASTDIWLRGEGTFIRVSHFDARRVVLEGVSIFVVSPDFSLRAIIEARSARWDGSRWEPVGAREWSIVPGGQVTQRRITSSLPLSETPDDLKVLAREPQEFSYFELQKQIADLKAKGIDTTESEVDLQIKIAMPLVAPLMALVAIPFAIRPRTGGGMAFSFGLTMFFAAVYFFLVGLSRSLGHSGALPPLLAAWLPNLTFAFVGLFFFTAKE